MYIYIDKYSRPRLPNTLRGLCKARCFHLGSLTATPSPKTKECLVALVGWEAQRDGWPHWDWPFGRADLLGLQNMSVPRKNRGWWQRREPHPMFWWYAMGSWLENLTASYWNMCLSRWLMVLWNKKQWGVCQISSGAHLGHLTSSK